jgi:GH43 family beta-xylosidase
LVANPDFLEFAGKHFLYFRGQDESGHDQIGLWQQSSEQSDGIHWDKSLVTPVIKVGTDKSGHDAGHLLDPASVVFQKKVFLYYTAKSLQECDNHSIALAVSSDGVNFIKAHSNPIIPGAIAPEVVVHNGLIRIFFQRHNKALDSWELYSRTSEDGLNFPTATEEVVFMPSYEVGAIDSKSIATVRIFAHKEYFYMTYAACQKFLDYPERFGLARSVDLLSWERIPSESIFERGEPGSWDEGAIWYPTIHKINEKFFLWYEGAGTGIPLLTEANVADSEQARNENYGGYLQTSFSQIGLAELSEADFKWA